MYDWSHSRYVYLKVDGETQVPARRNRRGFHLIFFLSATVNRCLYKLDFEPAPVAFVLSQHNDEWRRWESDDSPMRYPT